ncbi:MAG: PqqD family protein [Thermoanaerobaculia bacterium]
MSTSLPTPHENVVITEFEDGESVLVDLDTKRYYQLNETATVIWRALAEGRSRAEIADRLATVYDVSREEAEKSVDLAVGHLEAHRLVVTP